MCKSLVVFKRNKYFEGKILYICGTSNYNYFENSNRRSIPSLLFYLYYNLIDREPLTTITRTIPSVMIIRFVHEYI